MISGREVLTTVEASIDTNMPSMRPERACSTWRRLIPDSVSSPAGLPLDLGFLLDDIDAGSPNS
ncbi:hypothetical protein ACFPRL_26080 [Pseudoclavibacter helvolus]